MGNRIRNNWRAFSLIEVVIAAGILGASLLAFSALLSSLVKRSGTMERWGSCSDIIACVESELGSMAFEDIASSLQGGVAGFVLWRADLGNGGRMVILQDVRLPREPGQRVEFNAPDARIVDAHDVTLRRREVDLGSWTLPVLVEVSRLALIGPEETSNDIVAVRTSSHSGWSFPLTISP